MKLFHEDCCFALSSYEITAVPIVPTETEQQEARRSSIAATVLEDAAFLSSTGGQISIELMRIAGRKKGMPIRHIITIRSQNCDETECVTRHEASVSGLLGTMQHAGYLMKELSFEEYSRLSQHRHAAVCALRKTPRTTPGMQQTYYSIPVLEEEGIDWSSIYDSLDGSDAVLTIQASPSVMSDNEANLAAQELVRVTRAASGMIHELKGDTLAEPAARSWQYYCEHIYRPMAQVNILISGSAAQTALIAARIQTCCRGCSMRAVPVPEIGGFPVYSRPWQTARVLSQKAPLGFERWSCEEAANILEFPAYSAHFNGLPANAFSLIMETELIDNALTDPDNGIYLGNSVCSDQQIYLPFKVLNTHLVIFGKSGLGKTTLTKQLITELYEKGMPTLILEPVKREYRHMLRKCRNIKVYTVESPIDPLRLNPFIIPEGVELRNYKSCLMSCFKASISMVDPLPSLLERAISQAYAEHGFTDNSRQGDPGTQPFDMTDFVRILKRTILHSSYEPKIKGNLMEGSAIRLLSLCERCPLTFDTMHATPVSELLSGTAIIEMGALEPEQKLLTTSLLLITVMSHIKATRESSGDLLKNVILIDEAHSFFDTKQAATEEETALNSSLNDLLINFLSESRAYGLGIILADQSPTRIGANVLNCVETILSYRLTGEESELLCRNIGATPQLLRAFGLLKRGQIILANSYTLQPLPVRIPYQPPDTNLVTDQELAGRCAGKAECPYSHCRFARCSSCNAQVREHAKLYTTRIFNREPEKFKDPKALASVLTGLPGVLRPLSELLEENAFGTLCRCTAVHLLRKNEVENNVVLDKNACTQLFAALQNNITGGTKNG